jgi:hypothetical protein
MRLRGLAGRSPILYRGSGIVHRAVTGRGPTIEAWLMFSCWLGSPSSWRRCSA